MAKRIRIMLALSCIVFYSISARLPQFSTVRHVVRIGAKQIRRSFFGAGGATLPPVNKIRYWDFEDLFDSGREEPGSYAVEALRDWLATKPSLDEVNGQTLVRQQTLLHWAAGSAEAIDLLIKYGANVHARDYNAKTPLDRAVCAGNGEGVKLLLAAGACPNTQEYAQEAISYGWNALLVAVIDRKVEIVKSLLWYGADTHWADLRGWTALHYAAYEGNVAIARLLIDRFADVNACAHYSLNTPLGIAMGQGHLEMVQFLLDAGADISAKNEHDESVSALDFVRAHMSSDEMKSMQLVLEHYERNNIPKSV